MAATLDVIDMNEALLTAQVLHGGHRHSYGSDGEGESRPRYRARVEERMTMSDSERTIYNKLGDTSSPKNKVSIYYATQNAVMYTLSAAVQFGVSIVSLVLFFS